MKALIYKARENQWLVIINPDTNEEWQIADCDAKEFAVALCEGMKWEYKIAE